jgi:hypothetical protein
LSLVYRGGSDTNDSILRKKLLCLLNSYDQSDLERGKGGDKTLPISS